MTTSSKNPRSHPVRVGGRGRGLQQPSLGKAVRGLPLAQPARHRKLPPPAPHLGPGSPRHSEPSYPPEVAELRMAELGRPSTAHFLADPAESQGMSDLPQRAGGSPPRLCAPRRPLCLPEPPHPLPFPPLNTQHKDTHPGGYGEGPMIPKVECRVHGMSSEFTNVTVTTCHLQGAPSARPCSRGTWGDAAWYHLRLPTSHRLLSGGVSPGRAHTPGLGQPLRRCEGLGPLATALRHQIGVCPRGWGEVHGLRAAGAQRPRPGFESHLHSEAVCNGQVMRITRAQSHVTGP